MIGLERQLLERELEALPPPDLERQVWEAVAMKLPPMGQSGGSTNGAATDNGELSAAAGVSGAGAAGLGATAKTSSMMAVGIAKSLVIGALAGTVTMTGATVVRERMSVAPQVEQSHAPARAPAARAAETTSHGELGTRVEESQPPLAPAASPTPRGSDGRQVEAAAASVAPGQASSARFDLESGDLASRTRAERQVLQRARASLQAGDAAGALRLVEGARQAFPSGMLTQEREVLAIEALSAAGRRAEASARAGWFLRQFPNSPHGAHVERFAR
jgi:hypothetical protein